MQRKSNAPKKKPPRRRLPWKIRFCLILPIAFLIALYRTTKRRISTRRKRLFICAWSVVLGTVLFLFLGLNFVIKESNYLEHFTGKIKLPTGWFHKTENNFGEVEYVKAGDKVDYTVKWENYQDKEATIILENQLESGVDFFEASFAGDGGSEDKVTLASPQSNNAIDMEKLKVRGTVNLLKDLEDPGSNPEEVKATIEYEPETHTITWTLIGVPDHYAGKVEFSVIANENEG